MLLLSAYADESDLRDAVLTENLQELQKLLEDAGAKK